MIQLRPYQQEVATAVLDSVRNHRGLNFTVEMARQGGKNELSAQIEVLLLTMAAGQGGQGVKASPTFKPQTINSIQRLQQRLKDHGLGPYIDSRYGYQIWFGKAGWLFFSAAEVANVVGATATLLLEGDEAQDIESEKWQRDFRPMGATGNTTSVLWGTAWDTESLLEQSKQHNLELTQLDGIRRHFEYPWRTIGQYNPHYLAYVEAERLRLGPTHPLFTTQYDLIPLASLGRMFDQAELDLMRGDFPAEDSPSDDPHVAGLDIAGAAEQTDDQDQILSSSPLRDSTVLTIGSLKGQEIKVVRTYQWTDVPHHQNIETIKQLYRHWRVRNLVGDATGMGEPVVALLQRDLGRSVTPYKFTSMSKSELAYNLLAAAKTARLKIHTNADPDLWRQLTLARTRVRPNRTMNFFVDQSEGHDDFLMSIALMVEAARTLPPERTAQGR